MIITEPTVTDAQFETGTGWSIKPQGACRGEVCVPLPAEVRTADGRLDATAVAARLGMPVVTDDAHGVSALGPATQGGGHVLTSAVAPELELPDRDGNLFRLSSLHGRKVLLVAWASW
jgi:hypothetical protein